MFNTEINGTRYFNCCICNNFFEGWGNNPDPVTNAEGGAFDEEEECCNNCNSYKVMPARLAGLTSNCWEK
jgi:hypothetical protein